jgi:hypothetical protein
MLMAVEREVIEVAGNTDARLEWHLLNWKRWMRGDVVTDGYPSSSSGFIAGGYSQSFDDMADASDSFCAEAVNSIINGLPPMQQMAVRNAYHIAVFRFPRGNGEDLLNEAKATIRRQLPERGVAY